MRVRGNTTREQNRIFDTFPKHVDGNLTMTQIIGVSHLGVCACACVYRGLMGLADIGFCGKVGNQDKVYGSI